MSESETIRAEHVATGWCIVDDSGQRWWPAEDVQEAIQASGDPAAEIMRQYAADAAGTWRG